MRNSNTRWVGMDVHADSIQVAVYRSKGEAEEEYQTGTDERALARLVKRLAAEGGRVRRMRSIR